ncbi:MAG: hypothetical protein K1X85_05775 [Ignavibacteria bacterium]|nr:hypothetical protein [Ignavibacteria bacterium]
MKRRDFLKFGASGIALSALGAGLPKYFRDASEISGIDKYEHIVVLMLENRSFDNMLGYLYSPEEVPPGQRFEGVIGKNISNPLNVNPQDTVYSKDSVHVYRDTVMTNPSPDPGEEYPHVNTQLFSTILPDSNRYRHVSQMQPPYNEPFPVPDTAAMKGFVTDYIYYFKLFFGRYPKDEEYKIIMGCFPPAAVPVISTLAKEFAVCDHWFCSVPSQTYCNRSFFNSASSWGYVNNAPSARWIQNAAPTVYNRLSDYNVPWKVYFDVLDIIPATLLLHLPQLLKHLDHFCTFDKFLSDVATGNLPKYSFVEPRMHWFHNDEHPPDEGILQNTNFPGPSNVLAGERLIHTVYTAIKNSDSKNNNWKNTLLIITYDEHGGCHDHVPPIRVTPPYFNFPPPFSHENEMGFQFNRSGVRVPTVLVSAYLKKNTIINTEFEHTSVIKTLKEKHGFPYLTNRDEFNPHTLNNVFNLDTPRDRSTWPVTVPRPFEYFGDREYFNNEKLSGYQRGLVEIAMKHANINEPVPQTVGESLKMLERVKSIMFPGFCF